MAAGAKEEYAKLREAIETEFPPGKARCPPHDDNQPATLGENFDLRALVGALRKARQSQGLRLADIQEVTGIDQSALCRIESAENANPTVNTLIRYARAVGRRIDVTLVRAQSPKASSAKRPKKRGSKS
jgi:hypothetical protein